MTDNNKNKENEYAHWLFNVQGLGNKSIDKLLCNGMSCSDIYKADVKEFKGLLTDKQIKNLEQSKRIWDFDKEAAKLAKKDISFISRIDSRFPDKLKNIPDPPFALYVKGELPDPAKPSVAIIGARMCSEYGRYMARVFGRGLALAGVQVISGMARGVDGISQKAALAAGGKSYGIVGSGVDICYPEDNLEIYNNLCEMGGVISEFPPGTYPKANFFPMRNRIISGLADVVLVIEAREKSGTQITVDTALEQGREVLAVPGRVTDRLSDGCNLLISQGAGVAIGVDDVLERLWEGARSSRCREKTDDIRRNHNEDQYNLGSREESEGPETIEDEILELVDIIPVSSSQILEGLNLRGIDISVPQLMGYLMELNYKGALIQDGAYYRKRQ
ncbi:DNA-processing protein DprA [Butyrivibrio proteoclasticus]|nr:DNA-processing protein DprA [Butyrivibrio proteoclasticus]